MTLLPPKELGQYKTNDYMKIIISALSACLLSIVITSAVPKANDVVPYEYVSHSSFLDNVASKLDLEVIEVTATLKAAGISSPQVEKTSISVSEQYTGETSYEQESTSNPAFTIPYAQAAPISSTSELELEQDTSVSQEIQAPSSNEFQTEERYIMFSTKNSDTPSTRKDTVLAKIDQFNNVSIVSYKKDIKNNAIDDNVDTKLQQAYIQNNRDEIKNVIEQNSDITIDYYATVDESYLSELEQLIQENEEASAEWAVYQTEKIEAERIAAEEAAKPKTVIDDDLWYNQNDYEGFYYQDYFDIPTYGCGLCSTAVALDMLFDVDWDPVYVADRMQRYSDEHGGIQYCVFAGTSYPQWQQVVEGEFDVNIRKATSTQDAKDALADGKMIVAGNGGNVFKDSELNTHWHGGHIVCFYKTDGESVWSKDPAGCGGSQLKYTSEEFQQWWDWGGSNRMFIISRNGE